MSLILKRDNNPSEKLIYLAFASVFLPYILTGIIMVGLCFYILLSHNSRTKTFIHSGRGVFFAFSFYSAFIALIKDNYIGFACSIGFFFIFVISYYSRSVITSDIFQKSLDLCCWMSIIVFVTAVSEKLMYSHTPEYRCVGWFFNSNYLCSMMAMMIIVCIYKLMITPKGKPFYILTALCCTITMYLGGSIFAIVEVVVGIITLLILFKKRSISILFVFSIIIGALMLYVFPEIFPRILNSNASTDQRILVWDSALEFIKVNPLFGHGFLSYYHLQGIYGSLWNTAHTHNFVFETILNFGIVGSVLLVIFLWSYYEKISECKSLLRKTKAADLILAVSAAIIIHCAVDMTIQWIQTGLFFALLLSGIGIDEKTLNRRIQACLAKSQNKENNSREESDNG